MRKLTFLFLLSLVVFLNYGCWSTEKGEKRRILILTDIENEPDDAQSLVRFLLYSNQFDVEGIIATTSCWQRHKVADWRIHEIVDAYGKVHDNLQQHEQGYPTCTYLKKIIKKGYANFGMAAVGEGKDSEGSEWIIKIIDKDDPRPVWIPIWGGSNCLAQALWKIKETRTEEEINKFVSKIRVYAISDQDNSGPWIRNTFHDLFYIVSPGYGENKARGYFYATWTGISGESKYKFPCGANEYVVSNQWLHNNIQLDHGPLGDQYPNVAYIMEGDTPSFLFLINNGLNSPDHPNWGSWGGRYELYKPNTRIFFHEPEQRKIWTNTDDWVEENGEVYINNQATIWRWRKQYQNDFAARMDWCVNSFDHANHAPVAKLNHNNELAVKTGELIKLDASNSTDPDGNSLSYKWIFYPEAGTYPSPLSIENNNMSVANLIAPKVKKTEKLHFIVIVTDDGSPAITRYRRVIVTVKP